MNVDEATRIIVEYGAVLEKMAGRVAPISMLPYSKEEIKTAIKICIVDSMTMGILTEKMKKQVKNALEVSYVHLARFVNDEQAEIMEKRYRLLLKVKK